MTRSEKLFDQIWNYVSSSKLYCKKKKVKARFVATHHDSDCYFEVFVNKLTNSVLLNVAPKSVGERLVNVSSVKSFKQSIRFEIDALLEY